MFSDFIQQVIIGIERNLILNTYFLNFLKLRFKRIQINKQ